MVGIGGQVASVYWYFLERFSELSYHFFWKFDGKILDNFAFLLHFYHCQYNLKYVYSVTHYFILSDINFLNFQHIFQLSLSVLNFLVNGTSNVAYLLLNTQKHHHTETVLIFTILLPMSRRKPIYVISMSSVFNSRLHYSRHTSSFAYLLEYVPLYFGWKRGWRTWIIFK